MKSTTVFRFIGHSGVIRRLSIGMAVLSAMWLAARSARAGVSSVVSLSLNNVDAVLIPPPPSVTPDALTLNPGTGHLSAFVFEENNNVILPANLNVDVADTLVDIPSAFSLGNVPPGGVIPAGTRVSSVYVHFDTPLNEFGVAEFVVHLNEDILGVIMTDALLDASDPILGNGATAYPTHLGLRGAVVDPLEAVGLESVFIGVPGDGLGPSHDVRFRMEVEFVLDGVRIITRSVPEPTTALLLALALLICPSRCRHVNKRWAVSA